MRHRATEQPGPCEAFQRRAAEHTEQTPIKKACHAQKYGLCLYRQQNVLLSSGIVPKGSWFRFFAEPVGHSVPSHACRHSFTPTIYTKNYGSIENTILIVRAA